MPDANRISFTISPAHKSGGVPQKDGMIAQKKIDNYSYFLPDEIGVGYSSRVYKGKHEHTSNFQFTKIN